MTLVTQYSVVPKNDGLSNFAKYDNWRIMIRSRRMRNSTHPSRGDKGKGEDWEIGVIVRNKSVYVGR